MYQREPGGAAHGGPSRHVRTPEQLSTSSGQTGDIPVVPFFQIASAHWKYGWRQGREHDYCVFLVSRRGKPATFLLGLVHPHRWLVSYWQPMPVFC